MSMTDTEYLMQTQYFSESEGKLLDLEQMPFQHVYYAAQKLHQEFGDKFFETVLGTAFRMRLAPSTQDLQYQLRRYGKATLADTSGARQRLFRAAANLGVIVETHKERKWITAVVRTP